jgi:hypothetical protein
MTKVSADDDSLRTLSVADVLDYLLQKGWRTIAHPNNQLYVLAGPPDDNGEPIKLLLPKKTEFDDAYLRLAEAMNLIAAVYDRSAYAVIREIMQREQGVRSHRGERKLPLKNLGFALALTLLITLIHSALYLEYPAVALFRFRWTALDDGYPVIEWFCLYLLVVLAMWYFARVAVGDYLRREKARRDDDKLW